jgi:hypothetical protein
LPIIRVTKAQIEKANKARKAALLKDPEFRVYNERQQLRRQAASKQNAQIEDANDARKATPSNGAESRPCDERQPLEREAVPQKMEHDS